MFRSKSLASFRCQHVVFRPRRVVRFASTIQVQRVRIRRPFSKSVLYSTLAYLGYSGYRVFTSPPPMDPPEILALEKELLLLPKNDPSRNSKRSELDRLKRECRQKEIDKYGEERMASIHKTRDKMPEIVKKHNAAWERDLQALQSGQKPSSSVLFIPLWPVQQLPSVHYHSRHPEWQEFVKFSRDIQQQQRIKSELANAICSHFEAAPKISAGIGKPLSVRRAWLDIDYPSRPRVQYVQWGLVVSSEDALSLAFRYKLVDDTTYHRLEHALKPYALTLAAWTGYSTLLQHHWDKIKSRFQNDEGNQLSGVESTLGRTTIDAKTLNRLLQKPGAKLADSAVDSTSSATPPPAARQTPNNSGSQALYTKSEKKDLDEDHLLRCPPYIPSSMCQAIAPAVISFRKSLREARRKHYQPPARGCLMVSGFVELEGRKGTVVFDIHAFYDPKNSEWDNIYATPRRAAPKSQNPLGGR